LCCVVLCCVVLCCVVLCCVVLCCVVLCCVVLCCVVLCCAVSCHVVLSSVMYCKNILLCDNLSLTKYFLRQWLRYMTTILRLNLQTENRIVNWASGRGRLFGF
jgi:hypothetical protein